MRLDQFQLDAGSGLVVLPYLPAHAEAQSNHVVLLTVPRAAALDVVQQGRLQGTTLPRGKREYQGQLLTAMGGMAGRVPRLGMFLENSQEKGKDKQK